MSSTSKPDIKNVPSVSASASVAAKAGSDLTVSSPSDSTKQVVVKRNSKSAINASLVVNILLFATKLIVAILSGSLAVIASLTDSAIDLLGQVVISVSRWRAGIISPKFPAGKTRFESIGVITLATLMITLSIFIIREAIEDTITGVINKGKVVRLTPDLIIPVGAVIVVKGLLWQYCKQFTDSALVMALAQDHLNDVFSNSIALVAASVATFVPAVWFVDPVGAFLISSYIIKTWWDEAQDQLKDVVGRAASKEEISEIEAEVEAQGFSVAAICAYHVGTNLLVEVGIILNGVLVSEARAKCLEVQAALENMSLVERAFVFADSNASEITHKIPMLDDDE